MYKTFKLPDLAEGIDEATVVRLIGLVGKEIKEDELFCEMETDKAAVEIPSPFQGTIVKWHVVEGQLIKVGTEIVTVFDPRESDSGDDPAPIALHNLRLVNPDRIARPPFERYARLFEDARQLGRDFRGISLSRLTPPLRLRLLKVLYDSWSAIVDIRRYYRSKKKKRDTLKRIVHILDCEYETYLKNFRQVLDDAKQQMTPRVFIGSSTAALDYAEEIQAQLSRTASCSLWSDDPIFELNKSTLDALLAAIEKYDFGVFVFATDDSVEDGGQRRYVTRDNVIFEYGLFLGKLGRSRAFIVQDENSSILSDLKGITTARYRGITTARHKAKPTDLHVMLGPACNKIRKRIKKEWPWPL